MFSLIVNLLGIFAVIVGIFFATRKVVMMWTGSTKEEATKKIQNYITQREEYHLSSDQMLNTDIENALNDIIGDSRYDTLCKLARTVPLITRNYSGGLPYIEITISYIDENEKIRIENILTNIISKYLGIHGLCRDILADWNVNRNVKMPALMIRYAETEEQLKILNACLQQETTKIIEKYQPLKDGEI